MDRAMTNPRKNARRGVSALLLLAVLLAAPAAEAAGWTLVKGHAGVERRADLSWYGVSVGRYTTSLSSGSWAPEAVRRFIDRDAASLGVDFTAAVIDDDGFTQTRYDLSVVPKIHYFFADKWYWSAGIGVGYNELVDEDTPERELELGGKWFFAPEASLGTERDLGGTPVLIELYFTHRSNAGLGDANQSVNFFMLGVGTRIGPRS